MADSSEGAGRASDRLLLATLSGNMLLDAVEVSLVVVAIPVIAADQGLSIWTAQWLVTGFAGGFALSLMLGRRITARLGRRRAYLAAMGVFAAASVIGGLASGPAVLIGTRVVKGACAALTAPTGLAIISSTFPDGPERRRAITVYSMFGATGFTVGVLLAGALLPLSWRLVYLVPAVVALGLLIVAVRVVPANAGAPQSVTGPLPRGQILPRSALGAACLNGIYQTLLVIVVLELNAAGASPTLTAIALLPACLPLVLVSPFSGRMIARVGTPRLVAAGAVAACAGCGWYAVGTSGSDYPSVILPALLLVEAGFCLSFAALNTQVLSGSDAHALPRVVPIYQTAVQLGTVLVLPSSMALAIASSGHHAPGVLLVAVAAVGVIAALLGVRDHRTPAPSQEA